MTTTTMIITTAKTDPTIAPTGESFVGGDVGCEVRANMGKNNWSDYLV